MLAALVAIGLLAACERASKAAPEPAPALASAVPAPAAPVDEEEHRETVDEENAEVDPARSRDFEPGSHLGALHAGTSEKQLQEIYGAANLAREDWPLGEGDVRAATVAFKGSADEFWVIWKDDRFDQPERAIIVGKGWHSGAALQVGTGLRRLVKINGGDFDFLGFDWEYSGTVSSWRTGKLARHAGKLTVFLERGAAATDQAIEAGVIGDRSIASNQAGLDALGIRVRRIDLVF